MVWLAGAAWPLGAAEGHEWRPWPDGKPARPIDLPTAGGGRWRLADQRGRPVLLNFWASWCAPCRDEMPSLARLARGQPADGLVVVGINYRESAATVTRFLSGLGIDMTTLLDADGSIAVAYTPRIFPSSVLFDRRGKPLGTVVGELDWTADAAGRYLAMLSASR